MNKIIESKINNRIRIAFVHNKCPQYRWELFQKLSRIYPNMDFYFHEEGPISISVPYKNLRGYRIPKMCDYIIVPSLYKELRRKRYDLYICTDLGYYITHITFLVSQLEKKPFILWNGQWKDVLHPRRWLMQSLEKQIIRKSAACIVYGEKHKDFLIQRGAKSEKIFIAYNSNPVYNTSVSKEVVSAYRKKYGIYNKRVILFIGRLVKFKGIDILLKANYLIEKKYKDVFLLIAGAGPQEKELKKIKDFLGLRNVFISSDFIDESQKRILYSLADIFVLPSIYHKTPEPWGLVLNEAAAFEKPLITTNMVGASRDLVLNGENGFIVEQGDPKALSYAIEKLLSDTDLREKMGKRSKEIVQNKFSVEQMVIAFVNAFDYALKDNEYV